MDSYMSHDNRLHGTPHESYRSRTPLNHSRYGTSNSPTTSDHPTHLSAPSSTLKPHDLYQRSNSYSHGRHDTLGHTLRVDAGPSSRSARSRSRHRWPPSPYVESERTSLAREYKPGPLSDRGNVPMRGIIDQDPLMIEVQSKSTWGKSESSSQQAGSSRKSASTTSTPRDARPTTSIKTTFTQDDLPEFVARVPRPYGSSNTHTSKNKNRLSGEGFLSSEIINSPVGRNSRPSSRTTSPHDFARANGRARPEEKRRSIRDEHLTDESDIDIDVARNLAAPRARSSRYSFTGADMPSSLVKTSTRGSGGSSDEGRGQKAPSALTGNSRPRKTVQASDTDESTDKTTSRGSVHQQTRSRAQAAMFANAASLNTIDPVIRRMTDGDLAARSPHSAYPSSPPQSPQLDIYGERGAARDSRPQPRSRPNSRPSTPLSLSSENFATQPFFDAANSRVERQSTFPQVKTERIWPPARFSSSTHPTPEMNPPAPRIDVMSPSPRPPSKMPLPYPDNAGANLPYPDGELSPALPYPVHDVGSHLMPSETAFQFIHPSIIPSVAPSDSQARSPTVPAPPASAWSPNGISPNIAPSASVSFGAEKESTLPTARHFDTDPHTEVANTDGGALPKAKNPLECPRSRSVKGYDDWSTLNNDDTFNICPDCLYVNVVPTLFRDNFKPISRASHERIKCDFSRPWIRLSWLLTVEQQRSDLDLVYAASSISNLEDECPGDKEQKRSWYGIVDDDDNPVPDFYVCSRDRRFLEALFPTLEPRLTRISRQSHSCALDRNSVHFPLLLDILSATDKQSRNSKRSPDLKALTDKALAIKAIDDLPPCTKGQLSKGNSWHYMPSLPEFSVCVKCFAEVIQPSLSGASNGSTTGSNAALLDQFIRVPQSIPRENGLTRGYGSSCQLYSRRMRTVWARAVAENDERYLARKVRERKAVEMGTYETYATLDKLTQGSAYNKAHVKDELDRIDREWRSVE